MIKEQAELLERDFKEIVKDHNMKNGVACFIDKAEMAVLIFDNINDDEVMQVIANLVERIARKHKMATSDVIACLVQGMSEGKHLE